MPYYNDGQNTLTSNPAERPPQNPSEVVSNKMFNIVENVDGVVHPERKEIFNRAGVEFASGNYDSGQRLLETEGVWDEDIREVAIGANQADQERIGEKPLDYNGAKSVIDSIASQLGSSGVKDDIEGALIIGGIVRATEAPGAKGIEGIDQAIEYLEQTMKTQNSILGNLSPELRNEVLNQIKAKRAARDALYIEKQKRVEELKRLEMVQVQEEVPNRDPAVAQKREEVRQVRLAEVRRSLGMQPEQPQKIENSESLKDRLEKYKAYEQHRGSVERVVKSLQDARNTLEKSNNVSFALSMFEGTISMLTQNANPDDIEKLRGQPVDIVKEKQMFGIEDSSVDEYIEMREAQNALSKGESLKDVLDGLEKGLKDKYGITKIETDNAKSLKDLDALKIAANIVAESTDDPNLVGTIKEVKGIGYHIPDVPQYNVNGDFINTFNRDLNARPSVVTYKLNN